MAFTTGPVELERMMKNKEVNVVDVRAAEDYAEGHIPGAVSLPRTSGRASKVYARTRSTSSTVIRKSAILPPPLRCSLRAGLSDHGIGGRMAMVERRQLRRREVKRPFIDSRSRVGRGRRR